MHDRVAQELREHPGKWALIYETGSTGHAGQLSRYIRNGQVQCFKPAGAFDSVMRLVDGTHRVYARYIGPGGSDGG